MTETILRSVPSRLAVAGALGLLGLALFAFPAQAETPEEPIMQYGVTVTSPMLGYRLLSGTTFPITWVSSGSDIATVSLAMIYQHNGETIAEEIVADAPNTGKYEWVISDFDDEAVSILITGNGLGTVLAAGYSGVFSVVNENENAGDIFPGDMVVSPVTGEEEIVDDVDPGDIVQPWSLETVYGIEDNGDEESALDLVRRPFYDEATLLTYVDSTDEVMGVTDATMPTLALGQIILPQPGAVLVKFQQDNNVYAVVNEDGYFVLRWIPSESLAVAMYGADWKDYILEMSPTAYPHFILGEEVMTEMDIVVDMDVMKTADQLDG